MIENINTEKQEKKMEALFHDPTMTCNEE